MYPSQHISDVPFQALVLREQARSIILALARARDHLRVLTCHGIKGLLRHPITGLRKLVCPTLLLLLLQKVDKLLVLRLLTGATNFVAAVAI